MRLAALTPGTHPAETRADMLQLPAWAEGAMGDRRNASVSLSRPPIAASWAA